MLRGALRISSWNASWQAHRGIFALLTSTPEAVRCGSAGSGRFQLALWAGFTCVSGGFRQLTRWPDHLKGRREGFQNRRPSAAYST